MDTLNRNLNARKPVYWTCPVTADLALHERELDETAAFEEYKEKRLEELTQMFMSSEDLEDALGAMDDAGRWVRRITKLAREGDGDSVSHQISQAMAGQEVLNLLRTHAKRMAETAFEDEQHEEIQRERKNKF